MAWPNRGTRTLWVGTIAATPQTTLSSSPSSWIPCWLAIRSTPRGSIRPVSAGEGGCPTRWDALWAIDWLEWFRQQAAAWGFNDHVCFPATGRDPPCHQRRCRGPVGRSQEPRVLADKKWLQDRLDARRNPRLRHLQGLRETGDLVFARRRPFGAGLVVGAGVAGFHQLTNPSGRQGKGRPPDEVGLRGTKQESRA
jgi:hypothetical protein